MYVKVLYVMNSLVLFLNSETEMENSQHKVEMSTTSRDLVLRTFGKYCICLCVYTYYINILFLPTIWNIFYLFLTILFSLLIHPMNIFNNSLSL